MDKNTIKYINFNEDNIKEGNDCVKIRVSDKTLIFNLKKYKYSEKYFLDIYDTSYSPIVKNVALSANVDLTLGVVDDRLPLGYNFSVFHINNNGKTNDLKYPNLGKDYLLAVTKDGE